MPEPAPRSSTRIPGLMSSSSARKHRRVVGCRPVPKAIPGSSNSTTSSGRGEYSASRQLGTMTVRSPTRCTKKYSFHAFAQSASRSVRAWSGPTRRSLPSAQTAFSRCALRCSRAGSATARYVLTITGASAGIWTQSPSSDDSTACSIATPCPYSAKIAETASTASGSADVESSSHWSLSASGGSWSALDT